MRVRQARRTEPYIWRGDEVVVHLDRDDVEFMVAEMTFNSAFRDGFWQDMRQQLWEQLERMDG